MQQHIYYTKYALHFADMPISELVSIFNAQVHHRGWSSIWMSSNGEVSTPQPLKTVEPSFLQILLGTILLTTD